MPVSIEEIIEATEDLAQVARSPFEKWRRADPEKARVLVDAFGQSERLGLERRHFFKAVRDLLIVPIDPAALQREVVEYVKLLRTRQRTGGAQIVLDEPAPIDPIEARP